MEIKKAGVGEAGTQIAEKILAKLKESKRVLWLLPGGSAIKVAAEASKIIAALPHNNLKVTLGDERYGAPGHADSNLKQIKDAGFQLEVAPVLTGESLEKTTENFATALVMDFETFDYKIGLFGIGKDGHTAGLIPGTTAVEATSLTCGYKTDTFDRITITPPLILMLDEAMLYAEGEDKKEIIQKLQTEVEVHDMPAQILKQVPILTVFTNF